MIIDTKLEFKSYLSLIYILTYRKPIMIIITFVGFVMFVGSILYFLGYKIPFDEPPYFQIVFGFFTIGVVTYSVYSSCKKNFSSHGKLLEKVVYEFTDEKISQTGETFSSEMDWTKIYKVLELKDWILIYQSKQVANLLPKIAFGKNLDEFKRIVQNKNIKTKLRKGS
jgi:hypothetical protein